MIIKNKVSTMLKYFDRYFYIAKYRSCVIQQNKADRKKQLKIFGFFHFQEKKNRKDFKLIRYYFTF